MYEVTTITKTILITNDLEEAERRAISAFEKDNYVEIKEIISISPYYYAKSVNIYRR